MSRAPVGLRIRAKRKALGRTQASLAEAVGVSPSYLNLIENGKRSIGGALLKRLATELAVDLEALDGAADRRLIQDLSEVAAEPVLSEIGLSPQRAAESASEFVGRNGAWARALVALHRAYLDRDREAAALADRLNQDPFLNDAVHRMLTNAAAIRSASEILNDDQELDPEHTARFHTILDDESRRLSDVSRSIAQFLETAGTRARATSPMEEVDAFLFERGNVFPRLEAAAEAVLRAANVEEERWKSRMIDFLEEKHRVRVVRAPNVDGDGGGVAFDGAARRLAIVDSAPEPTRRFHIAKLAAALTLGDAIQVEIDGSSTLKSDRARAAARNALASYCAGAMILPIETFFPETERARYDIDVLRRRFSASFEQVAHRFATLRRPGVDAPRFAFMRSDPAGYVTKRFPLPNLALPRRGGACPLWAVYRAFQAPETVDRQLVVFPNGDKFLFIARALSKVAAAFGRPRHLVSVMIACDAHYADRLVYGDALAVEDAQAAEPVGPSCRLCSRAACAHRQEKAAFETENRLA